MMANRDIVSEAVEQAEAMKQAAYENAKNVLVEAMSTNLQAAVAEAIDEKLDTEDVEISEEVVAEETVEEGAHDTDEMEDKDEMAHMDELEDEDDDDDDEEVDIDIDIDADGDDDDDEDEEELDEVDLDEVIEIVEDEDEMDEGEHEDADEGEDMDEVDMEDDEDVEEIGKMYKEAVAEVESLRTENKRYAKALKVLRTRIEEVNLFNARLAAATDVMNQVTLTKEQKERVVEHFDSCDTLDEVTRMAGVLKEAHETTAPSKNRTQRPNVQSVISENKTEAPGGFDRLAQLAGL
jgi:hypothetical protein|tara:strand:- start:3936 stop:4817 length:882 start_codon:yes stop_codon:yes gene_type:complete